MDQVAAGGDDTASKRQKVELEMPLPPKAFEQVSLLVQKLSSKGRLPTRGSAHAAGYDIYS